jgi:DNA-binding winged helix-turn-helix (wHTH) protein
MKTVAANEVTELFKQAVSRGQVVVVVPATPTPMPVVPRSESSLRVALTILFKLTRGEARVLVRLPAPEHVVSPEELYAAITPRSLTPKPRSISAIICYLRKKLDPFDIRIATVRGVGFCLTDDARDRIRELLARYDAKFGPDAKPAAESG